MTETKDTTDVTYSQKMSSSDITVLIKTPEKTQDVQFLEKMSRKLYECTDCQETFPSTESLKTHADMHLNGERNNSLSEQSENKINQKGSTDSQSAYLRDKFPTLFSRRVLIKLEKVDAKEIEKETTSCIGSYKGRETLKGMIGCKTARDNKGMHVRNIWLITNVQFM